MIDPTIKQRLLGHDFAGITYGAFALCVRLDNFCPHEEAKMTTAKNYLSLGETFEEKGKYFKAERLYRKALKAMESDGGVDQRSLLPYLYNLGMIQAALDKTSQSIKNLGRTLSILIELEGEDNEDVRELRRVLDELHPQPHAKVVNS